MRAHRVDRYAVAPATMNELRGVEAHQRESGLDRKLIELVKMRTTQILLHAACTASPRYSPRERAAHASTEAPTLIADGHAPDDVYEETRRHLDDKALADLTMLVGMINLWNRVATAFRYEHPWEAAA